MVNKIVEALKTMQDNVGLVKYPTIIVGSAIALNKLRKYFKARCIHISNSACVLWHF